MDPGTATVLTPPGTLIHGHACQKEVVYLRTAQGIEAMVLEDKTTAQKAQVTVLVAKVTVQEVKVTVFVTKVTVQEVKVTVLVTKVTVQEVKVTVLVAQVITPGVEVMALVTQVTTPEVRVTALLAQVTIPEVKGMALEARMAIMEVKVTAGTRVTTLEVMVTQIRTDQEVTVTVLGVKVTVMEAKTITQEDQATLLTMVITLEAPMATPTIKTTTGEITRQRLSAPIQSTRVFPTCSATSCRTIQRKEFALIYLLLATYSCQNALVCIPFLLSVSNAFFCLSVCLSAISDMLSLRRETA